VRHYFDLQVVFSRQYLYWAYTLGDLYDNLPVDYLRDSGDNLPVDYLHDSGDNLPVDYLPVDYLPVDYLRDFCDYDYNSPCAGLINESGCCVFRGFGNSNFQLHVYFDCTYCSTIR
jgi:hypothetical protein